MIGDILFEKDKVSILEKLVKGNLIFPYNIYPSFLDLVAEYIHSDYNMLMYIIAKKNNSSLSENMNALDEAYNTKPNFNNKVKLVSEIQFQSANNTNFNHWICIIFYFNILFEN